MTPDKSREHRLRVLQNQMRLAERAAADQAAAGTQLKMPLLVEVKRPEAKQPARRTRRKPRHSQADFGEL